MKAARLNTPGQPLQVENVPEPALLPGSVKIRVERATVPSFTAAVLSGQMPFPLPVPYTPGPGCIGVIETLADDVIGLAPGQRVLCSPHYSIGANSGAREEILIGWFGLTPGSGPLLERWKNGAFAERAVYPAGCVTPLGNGDPAELIRLAPLCIAYGGLLRCDLRPGRTLMVNGATGNLGAASVLVALALGVERVYAVGRNPQVLAELHDLDPKRVVPVKVDTDETYAEKVAAQSGPVDAVLDVLGYVQSPKPTLACIPRVKRGGSVVFMGGVVADIPLSYLQMLSGQLTVRGSFMHPASAPAELMCLARSGLLDLGRVAVAAFALDKVNEAIMQAPQFRGLSYCCIAP